MIDLQKCVRSSHRYWFNVAGVAESESGSSEVVHHMRRRAVPRRAAEGLHRPVQGKPWAMWDPAEASWQFVSVEVQAQAQRLAEDLRTQVQV